MRSTSRRFSYAGTRPSCFLTSDEITGRATEFSRPAGAGGPAGGSPAGRTAAVGTRAISQTKRFAGMAGQRQGRGGGQQKEGRQRVPAWAAYVARRRACDRRGR